MSSELRSTRHPWVRTGLMGLVPLLLPLVWAVEVESCGNALQEKEITGTMVVGHNYEGWLVVGLVLIIVLSTPYLANLVRRPGLRVLVHALGLAAAVLAGWGAGFSLYFSIFGERTATWVGWGVLGAFAASLIDALLRLVWSAQEWLKARAQQKALPG